MRILRKESTGSDVVQLQSSLKIWGYDPGPIDGIFGSKTQSAVIQFQHDYGLRKDGVVGQITWDSIQTPLTAFRTYMIKPGDTLYKIAQANNMSLSDLLTINPGINPKKLLTDQLILLAGITYPPNGAVLPYGNVTITWTAVPGATGYRVDVHDMGTLPYLGNYAAAVPANTTSFILTTDHITSGSKYRIIVFWEKTDPTTGSGTENDLGKVDVTIGASTVKPLIIISPTQNATIVQGSPVILKWDVPADSSGLNAWATISSDSGSVTNFQPSNGSNISQLMTTPGKYTISVGLSTATNFIYQGSTDITIVPR